MKAYTAHDAHGCGSGYTIVFAENAGRAKALATCSRSLEGADFIDIRVRREPKADKLYKGKPEINWWDDETRLVLVRDLGWQCEEASEACTECVAREFCGEWEAYLDAMEGYGE